LYCRFRDTLTNTVNFDWSEFLSNPEKNVLQLIFNVFPNEKKKENGANEVVIDSVRALHFTAVIRNNIA